LKLGIVDVGNEVWNQVVCQVDGVGKGMGMGGGGIQVFLGLYRINENDPCVTAVGVAGRHSADGLFELHVPDCLFFQGVSFASELFVSAN